jgi:hypothetical protein
MMTSDGLVEEAANFTAEIVESTGTLPPIKKLEFISTQQGSK